MSSDRVHVGLLVALTATFVLSTVRADDVPSDTMRLAEARFRRGLELAREDRCEAAAVEFEASLALVERASTHFNLARCDERLGRLELAMSEYRAFLALSDPSHERRLVAEERIESLRARLGSVDAIASQTTFLEPSTTSVVDADVADPSIPESSPEPARDPARAEEESVAPRGVPDTSPAGHGRAPVSRIPFGVSLGVASASLLVGAAFGTEALVLHREGTRIDPYDATRRAAYRDAVRVASRRADAFFAVSLGAAIVTIGTAVFPRFRHDEPRVRVAPIATAELVGAVATGRLR